MTSDSSSAQASAAVLAIPQLVSSPLTKAAIFLVVTINPGNENRAPVLSLCADLSALLRSVGFRALEGSLSCIMGFGSDAWDRLFDSPRPAELHPFREIRSGPRHAVSTPGDLVFHIRAKRMDLCFELATQIMTRLEGAVTTVDEVHGFRYFDERDLLGFVDGTENPTNGAAADAVFIRDEDPAFAGGSYVIVQKYFHNLDAWNELPTEAQEKIIGRKKLSDIELDDSVKPTSAHNALTVIEENGREIKILRDNMPFGRPATASSAPTSSATAARPAPSNKCSKTCSSAARPAIMIASWTSARRSPEVCSSSRPPRSSTVSPLTDRRDSRVFRQRELPQICCRLLFVSETITAAQSFRSNVSQRQQMDGKRSQPHP